MLVSLSFWRSNTWCGADCRTESYEQGKSLNKLNVSLSITGLKESLRPGWMLVIQHRKLETSL
jgi:hypothetical protein